MNVTEFTCDHNGQELTVRIRILKCSDRIHPYPEYHHECWKRNLTVKIEFPGRRYNRKLAKYILHRHFSYSYCNHVHDCCGCVTHRAYLNEIRHVKGKEFTLTKHSSVNC